MYKKKEKKSYIRFCCKKGEVCRERARERWTMLQSPQRRKKTSTKVLASNSKQRLRKTDNGR